jgi:hypothetical protein
MECLFRIGQLFFDHLVFFRLHRIFFRLVGTFYPENRKNWDSGGKTYLYLSMSPHCGRRSPESVPRIPRENRTCKRGRVFTPLLEYAPLPRPDHNPAGADASQIREKTENH